MRENEQRFLWLHLRKCGGTSLKDWLGDRYQSTNNQIPTPFVALPRNKWNGNLNNHMVPLGDYDYRRMLFARKFLFDETEFDEMFKFAICRNPYERALSCWRYLTKDWRWGKPRHMRAHRSLDYFLDLLPEVWEEKWDRHVATHTAPVWPDVSDENSKLLLDRIYKLEELDSGIEDIANRLLVSGQKPVNRLNRTGSSSQLSRLSSKTLDKINCLYSTDVTNLGYELRG